MAAPNYVPKTPGHRDFYESPPRRDRPWLAARPGDIPDGMPSGPGIGNQGPDQGYALKLVKSFEAKVHLSDGERWEDAAAGCVAVGLKRASLFGRAPVTHDLDIAFRIFGFLDEEPDQELVAIRAERFERVDNPHHYREARRLVDMVPPEVLRMSPREIAAKHKSNWRALVHLASEIDA